MTICRSCKKSIAWAMTDAGKRMPVDPTPVPNGNVARWGTDDNGTWRVRVLKRDEKPDDNETLHTSHFATCDDPKRFRK